MQYESTLLVIWGLAHLSPMLLRSSMWSNVERSSRPMPHNRVILGPHSCGDTFRLGFLGLGLWGSWGSGVFEVRAFRVLRA